MALSLTVKLAQPMAAKMRRASSPHFVERSEFFRTNPRRAERTGGSGVEGSKVAGE
jgi:hypothetical protein